jgi:predicted nuclease of predicted toxin-antitoxin system
MRFIIDANLPRSLATSLRRLTHIVTDVRDVGMHDADDESIAALAKREGAALVTRDFDFADVRNYPPASYPGIVVINYPSETAAQTIVAAIESALEQPELLAKLPGALIIIEPGRVRLRSG